MNIKTILILILVSSPSLATKIYTWVDENGVKHYSATEPEETDKKSNYKEKELKDGASSDSTSGSSVSNSSPYKATKKPSKDQKNCQPEPEKGWDAATVRNIRGYYNTRTGQCKQFYKKGSSQIKNCFQEQKEIKEKKMKEHRKRMKSRCR